MNYQKNEPVNTSKVNTQYLTRKEAAKFLRVSVRSLDQKTADGDIPFHKLGNGMNCRVLFNIQDLVNYIENCRIEM